MLSAPDSQTPDEMAAARQLRVAAAISTWGLDVSRAPRPTARASWFAIQTRSRFEFSVREQLRSEGFDEFLPTWDQRVKWSDREKVTTRPLFPGYIFVRFDPADAPLIYQLRGVVTILSTDQIPISIPDDEIADLRQVVEHPVTDARCPYVAGARVTVATGTFAGQSAVISRIKGGTLLTLLLPMFGRETPVQIEACDVQPADAATAQKHTSVGPNAMYHRSE